MLEIWPSSDTSGAPLAATALGALTGLREDTDYVILCPGRLNGSRLYIDDLELAAAADGRYRWRPGFYAGRVLAEVVNPDGSRLRQWLDVGPSERKSGDECFAEMVGQIREFDAALLGGASAATMAFGRHGRAGRFTADILLSRLREHGPAFVETSAAITRAPHRSLSADLQLLPLSRVRRLHPSALRDRRVAALCSGTLDMGENAESIQLRSLTSIPTFDTPANRALVALMQRLLAAIIGLRGTVAGEGLGADFEEQAPRVERRLWDLAELESRVRTLLTSHPFSEVARSGTTAAGLTQIAAQPAYSEAYRLGCMALSTAVDGDAETDALHVNHSWGIYESWCYLAVLQSLRDLLGVEAEEFEPAAVSAQLAHRLTLKDGDSVEVHFQARFPAEAPSKGRVGFSITGERYPDVLVVHRGPGQRRSLVLDAKWRSGRSNVLQAMESAHIYHDALRLEDAAPNPCLLLLPGTDDVPSLSSLDFRKRHGVGTVVQVSVGQPGLGELARVLGDWLGLGATPLDTSS